MGREFERQGYIIAVVKQHSYSVIFCDDAEKAVEMSEGLGDACFADKSENGRTSTVLLAKVVHIDRSDWNGLVRRRNKSGSISEMEKIVGMDISDFLDKQFQASDIESGDEELEEVSTGMDAGKIVEIPDVVQLGPEGKRLVDDIEMKLKTLSDGAKQWLIQHIADALERHEGERPRPTVLKELVDHEVIVPTDCSLADDTWDEICSVLEAHWR